MHRPRLMLFLALLTLPFCSVAQPSADSLYAKAAKDYAAKKFEAAADGYQQIIDSGVKTSAVYYNLGNAHYRLNSYAAAILNYERAYRLSPNDKDINANLALANSKITDKMEVVPELFLKRWWISFLLLLSVQGWSILGVILILAGFIGLVIYLFSKELQLKRISFYSGLTALFFGVCSVSFANAAEGYLISNRGAIVFNGAVNVKSAPDNKQKTLMVIHEGTKVRILDDKGAWLKVELPNGTVGWVDATAFQSI